MKVKPIVKYKAGMKVVYKDSLETKYAHKSTPEFYPEIGTTGIIKKCRIASIACLLIKWETGSTHDADTWWCPASYTEVVE